MSKKIGLILRIYLILGSIYLLADALVHLFDLRLIDLIGHWDQSALEYSSFLEHLYASFAILAVIFSLIIQSDLKKYRTLLKFSGGWSILYGLLLVFESYRINLTQFTFAPSLTLWLPFYNQLLWVEAVILIGYGVLCVVYLKRTHDTKS